MEAAKSLVTGVHSVPGYAVIRYRLFSVQSKSSPDISSLDRESLELLEARLHEQGQLAVKDLDTGCLWLFESKQQDGLPDADGSPDVEVPSVEKAVTRPIAKGLLKLSDIPKARLRAMLAVSGKPPVSPSSANLATQIRNAKAVAANAGEDDSPTDVAPKLPDFDASLVLPWFIASVETSVSFQLASKLDYIPLNCRTWAIEQHTYGSPLTPPPDGQIDPVILLSLNAYITTTGNLVLAFTSITRSDMCALTTARTGNAANGLIVRLAPNGGLAKVITRNSENVPAAATAGTGGRHPVTSPNRLHDSAWKITVTTWLKRKGLSLTADDAWTKVRLSQDATAASKAKGKHIECLWPVKFCYAYTAPAAADRESREEESKGLQWFGIADSAVKDPLESAQRWFMGTEERERNREAKKKLAAMQQEQTAMNESGIYPTSPFYTRPDLMAAGGVYPTPPDGIMTQPTTTTQAVDTPYAAPSTVETQPVGATPMDPTGPAEDLTMEDTSPADADKDLFGDMDMDEDNFAGNELSDADFNFFDEPDDEALSDAVDKIADAATLADTGEPEDDQSEIKAPDESRTTDINTPAVAAPEASQGPPLTLHNATADFKVPDTPVNVLSRPVNRHQPLDRRRMLGSATTTDGLHPYHFGNIRFHDQITSADAKYSSGGIFSAHPSSTSRHHELPLTDRRRSTAYDSRFARSSRGSASGLRGAASARVHHQIMSPKGRVAIIESDSDTEDSADSASADDFPTWNDVDDGQLDTSMDEQENKTAGRQGEGTTTIGTPTLDMEDEAQAPSLQHSALEVSDIDVITLLEPEYADWSLAHFPAPTRNILKPSGTQVNALPNMAGSTAVQKIGTEPNIAASIGVAQLIAQQAATSTLQLLSSGEAPGAGSPYDHAGDSVQSNLPEVSATLAILFPDVTHLDLAKYAQIQDAPFEPLPGSKVLQRPGARKPPGAMAGADPQTLNTPFLVNPQHVRVRRGEILWDLLPTALPFWELLGLGPVGGPKNLVTYCIYPDNDALADTLNSFIVGLGSTYEGCKLGSHRRGPALPSSPSDLIPVKAQDRAQPTYESLQNALQSLSARLGADLASVDFESDQAMQDANQTKTDEKSPGVDNIVLYAIDVLESSESLRDLCAFFWSVREAYRQTCHSYSLAIRNPDLVLQIIPISCITSTNAPVFLEQKIMVGLAREVYDRCPPSSSSTASTLSIRAAPSIQLEETIPRAIPFRLTADPAVELLHDCSHLHLGYAISWSGNWMTAAWTDGFGKYQTMASYSMTERAFGEIAKEIWQTTIGIMLSRRVNWRVTIARAGTMDREEIEAWASLVSSASPVHIGAVLLTIDTAPSLQLARPSLQNSALNNTVTPVATPQGVSPSDPTANAAATPSDAIQDAANDPDAHLVDVTDEIWGVILGHRLSNSSSLMDIRPSLASGFLVNVGSDGDGARSPQCTAYNIIWIGSSARASAAAANPVSSAQNQPMTPMTPGAQTPHSTTAAAFAQGIAASLAHQQQQQQQPQQRQGPSLPHPAPGPAAAGATPRFGGATIDPILKEYLNVYRGLSLLARLRGMKGTREGTAPWHIVAAMNAVKALDECMTA